ncbi:MAG: hypothetical protein QOJ15_1653 [Bradyrhizobium sp.]|jgi:hypothetical protein|nr:hypothetical protein [Bradyrhizobium sp.]
MDDNVIELAAWRPTRTARSVQAEPSAEILDVLLHILTEAKARGSISREGRLRFAAYAAGVVGEGWELRALPRD